MTRSESELVDWISRLEEIKCTAEAVQAEAAVRLEETARARQAEAGIRARKLGEGVAICRTNGCDAPIRNVDHVERHADGGATSAQNLQGLCERCNQAKEALGRRGRPGPDGSILTITPSGHIYVSPPPDSWAQKPPPLSGAEFVLRDVLLDYRLAA